jgi:hypothetical protein
MRPVPRSTEVTPTVVAVASDEERGAGDRPEAILTGIIHDLLELPDLVGDPKWDTFSAVVEVNDASVAASAFRYQADRPPTPTSVVRDLGAFRRLRDSMRTEAPEPWVVCIVRIHRDTARSTVNFVYPDAAALWRITPATYARVAEALRPVEADFAGAEPSA